VFPEEKAGAAGDNFEAIPYDTDPTNPIGNIKEAWEGLRSEPGAIAPIAAAQVGAGERLD